MKKWRVLFVLLLGLLLVCSFTTGAFAKGKGKKKGKVRRYYIQAEDVMWEYAPTGMDMILCGAGPCPIVHPWDGTNPGGPTLAYPKVRYIEYTDETFTEKVPQPEWLGIMGPIIRAEVGDTVKVLFKNASAAGEFGIHPHGFRYTKEHEGAFYFGSNSGEVFNKAGTQVAQGETWEYTWFADKDSSPGPGDPSSLVWWYHSHVDEPAETNLGLIGAIVIIKKGWAKEKQVRPGVWRPFPRDVDKEFIAMYFIFDEDEGNEPGLMHAINGYLFGNLKGLIMNKGDRVRWYNMGMGNEVDLHTSHWHGKVVYFGNYWNATKTDVVELLPGSMKTVTMKADNVGEWIMHCHVADHILGGMLATFQILP